MIDPALYWSLPTPRSLIHKISTMAKGVNVIAINTPKTLTFETRHYVSRGLAEAHIDREVPLIVRAGTDISSDVGEHIRGSRISAAELAHIKDESSTALILHTVDDEGWRKAVSYVTDFVVALRAIPELHCPVRIVIDMHDADIPVDREDNPLRVIAFDGALSPDEMDAYVSLRLIEKNGNGSSGRHCLTKSIIAGFALYDPVLAERLMEWESDKVISIRDHLSQLLDDTPLRWVSNSWIDGTLCSLKRVHPLRLQYIKMHGSHRDKEAATAALDRIFWKACVKEITPWMEERRQAIIHALNRHVQARLDPNSGRYNKKIDPKSNFTKQLSPTELEFSDVAYWARNQLLLPAPTAIEQVAIQVCGDAKKVRDDLAHLRAPQPSDIHALFAAMDEFEIRTAGVGMQASVNPNLRKV